MRAWLITWEWASDSGAVFDRIAAVLNPRLAIRTVMEHVEFLYALSTSSVENLAAYARNRKNNPYPAQLEVSGHVICGAHPWLRAQGVKDFKVASDDETGRETVSWHTLPIYRLGPNGRETVSGGRPESHVRMVVGPLSRELAWDRMKGAFKDGYVPRAF